MFTTDRALSRQNVASLDAAPNVRFSIRSLLALTALVGSCVALMTKSNGDLLAVWLFCADLWAIGVPRSSRWRHLWWSWAAVVTLPSAVLFDVASLYTTRLPILGRVPRIGAGGHYVVAAFVWCAVGVGIWSCYRTWYIPRIIAKISSLLSAATLAVEGATYLWLVMR